MRTLKNLLWQVYKQKRRLHLLIYHDHHLLTDQLPQAFKSIGYKVGQLLTNLPRRSHQLTEDRGTSLQNLSSQKIAQHSRKIVLIKNKKSSMKDCRRLQKRKQITLLSSEPSNILSCNCSVKANLKGGGSFANTSFIKLLSVNLIN